jgi:hypothetical protein
MSLGTFKIALRCAHLVVVEQEAQLQKAPMDDA